MSHGGEEEQRPGDGGEDKGGGEGGKPRDDDWFAALVADSDDGGVAAVGVQQQQQQQRGVAHDVFGQLEGLGAPGSAGPRQGVPNVFDRRASEEVKDFDASVFREYVFPGTIQEPMLPLPFGGSQKRELKVPVADAAQAFAPWDEEGGGGGEWCPVREIAVPRTHLGGVVLPGAKSWLRAYPGETFPSPQPLNAPPFGQPVLCLSVPSGLGFPAVGASCDLREFETTDNEPWRVFALLVTGDAPPAPSAGDAVLSAGGAAESATGGGETDDVDGDEDDDDGAWEMLPPGSRQLVCPMTYCCVLVHALPPLDSSSSSSAAVGAAAAAAPGAAVSPPDEDEGRPVWRRLVRFRVSRGSCLQYSVWNGGRAAQGRRVKAAGKG